MANRKYVRILAKDLPDLFFNATKEIDYSGEVPQPREGENVYFVRYRVTSEDGRLASRWSQTFEIPNNITGTQIALSTDKWDASINGNVLSMTWNVDSLFDSNPKKLFVKKFHVYVRPHTNATASTAKWRFMQETTATSFSTTLTENNTKADVMVLLPTYRGLDAATESQDSPALLFPDSVLFIGEDV